MRLWQQFWNDEAGLILSSEAVLLGTLGVLGATVGLSAASKSVNEELTELAFAFRSLDQSYCVEGTKACSGWTAGSEYYQPPVEESLKKLCAHVKEQEEAVRKEVEQERDELKAQERRVEEERKRAEDERKRAEARKKAEAQKKAEQKKKKKDREDSK